MRRYLRYLLHQATFLAPIAALVLAMVPVFGPPPVAEAAVSTGPAFGSAVACLNGAPAFGVTRTEDTVFANPNPGAYAGVQTLTFGGATVSQATLAQIGAVYSLAYDDGAASGQERLFVAAYTRRFVNYGPAGAGGIYVLNRSGTSWVLAGSVAVPGASGVAHTVGNDPPYDAAATASVGRSALGGMVVSPDGKQLYVVNVGANNIARFNLGTGLPTYASSFPIDLNQISTAANVRVDLTAFALQWWVHPSQGTDPLLLVGVTDTARRGVAWGVGGQELEPRLNASGAFQTPPRAYVLLYNTVTGTWAKSVDLDLGNTASIADRLEGSAFLAELPRPANYGGISYGVKGWNPWRNNLQRIARLGQEMRYPQPLLTNIEFVRETAPTSSNPEPLPMMLLGIRDRTGDIAFNNAANLPAGEYSAISQGDVLALRLAGGTWNIVARDYFNDNALPMDNAGSTKHLENFTGAISRIPGAGTQVGGAGDTVALMGLAGLRHSGVYANLDNAATGGASDGYTNLIDSSHRAATKATNLGDVEFLCSYALVGGRVWNDADSNGIQGGSETGIAGIRLEAYNPATSAVMTSATTDSLGRYLFAVPPNTSLQVRINTVASGSAISGYYLTRQNVTGSNDANDSDAAQVGGAIPFVRAGDSTTLSGAITAPWRDSDRRSYDIGLTRAMPTGYVGDFVWLDSNGDGIQNESPLAGHALPGTVTLDALSSEPGVVDRTATVSSSGRYGFDQVTPGTYRLIFPAPAAGFRASPQDRGGDNTRDSDPSASSYTTASFTVYPDNPSTASFENRDGTWDFGVIGGADVWITKSASATTVPVQGQFTYTLTYGNRTGQATSVVLNDTLPVGLTFVSASPAPTTRSGQALSWNLGTLNAGVSGSIQITVRAPITLAPSTAVSQVVQNCATITTVVTDLIPADNSSCVNTTVQRPEVSITKAAPATALVGDEFTYTLIYNNSGAAPAANVAIRDTLPTGIQFVRWVSNPGNACGVTSGVVSCSLGTLAAGASGQVAFTVRANVATMPGTGTAQVSRNTAVIGPGPDPTSSTPWPGDTPGNNTSSTDTSIQFPDPSISIFINPAPSSSDPEKLPVGEWGSIDVTYGNSGAGVARSSSLTVTYGAGATLGSLPSIPGGGACTVNTTLRQIICPLGDLPASSPTIRTVRLPIRLPATPADAATFAGDSYAVSGVITTSTPERVTHQANNSANDTTQVIRPNPRVFVAGPPAEEVVRMTWGSAYYYTVRYDNLYVARPYLTRAAANTVLRVVLPDEVELLSASVAPATQNDQELTWNLGTLAPQQAGSIRLAVRTDVPVNTTLHLDAYISTTTPGDDLSDNHDEADVEIVPPPPAYPSLASALQLAIHSDLDPRHGGPNDRDGVYYAEGDTIAWPAGEVLDFSPRLNTFEMDPAPFPLEYRARVLRWRIVGYEVNGRDYPATGADSRGVAGCRQGGSTFIGADGQTTCAYPYIGADAIGRGIEDFLPTLALREPEMASQGHVYWTKPVAPPMRNDVYLFTVDPMEAVSLTVAVDVEVWTLNACPDINIEPFVCGEPIEEPQPPREVRPIEQTFTVKLLVPRSVVGPGRAGP